MTSVYTSKEDYVYGEGEEIAINVVYSHDVDVLGTPSIPLNSGGEAFFTLKGRSQVPLTALCNTHFTRSKQSNEFSPFPLTPQSLVTWLGWVRPVKPRDLIGMLGR